MRKFLLRVMPCLLLGLLLVSCAERQISGPAGTRQGYVADLGKYPQDLSVFAARAGADRQLLTFAEQSAQDARWNRRFFSPWRMTRISVPLADVTAPLGSSGKPRGHAENLLPWDISRWGAMTGNMNAASYPSQAWPGIVVRNSSLRELPTLRPMFVDPDKAGKGYPFDMFQRSAIWLGTPVFVGHASGDGAWLYVETGFASGWIPAADVARVEPSFAASYESGSYAGIVRDDVSLRGADGTFLGTVHIGTVLPVLSTSGTAMTLLVPVREASGLAAGVPALVVGGEAVRTPMPLTPGNIATLGNRMMGQPYGWGGLYEDRDCSSTLRDLFAPFGIWLPRNSAAQAKAGRFVDFAKDSPRQKERIILAEGVPFMTLLWLRGHITLYVGEQDGRAVMFHNMWGVRVDEGGEEGRHVLGRAVITSTQPGLEVPGNTSPDGLLGRMQGMSILPGEAR